jgi:GntR family transcriptional regulator / MocR family aminotransferase
MTDSWANLGLDVHLERAGRRVRAGLEGSLREAVQTGRLLPGTRLPPSRTLARDLGVARNTVAEAYGQLVAEGWLAARRGSGTVVAEQAAHVAAPERSAAAGEPRIRYDLRPGRPDLGMFPRAAWLGATRRALADAPDAALGYGDPRGVPELRQALAGYLGRVRGVRASADVVVVCTGFVQALGLVCRVAAAAGARRIGVEARGLDQHRAVAARTGLEIARVAVDADGAVVEALGDADLALLTPAHQFPMGVPLAPGRRRAAVDWASTGGRLIVEDDYDGEFRYDRRAVGAMQALAPDRIVYAGTASKSLAPGLRLAWMVAPAELVGALAEEKALADSGSAVIDQLALAHLIRSGGYDRHVRRCRLTYQRRRERLVTALGRGVPGARVVGVPAGLHVLVELPGGMAEADVVAAAARRGVAVLGLDAFGGGDRPALVVGYATPPEHAFTTAVARLMAALAEAG